mgnify:CR=1 FL=1
MILREREGRSGAGRVRSTSPSRLVSIAFGLAESTEIRQKAALRGRVRAAEKMENAGRLGTESLAAFEATVFPALLRA